MKGKMKGVFGIALVMMLLASLTVGLAAAPAGAVAQPGIGVQTGIEPPVGSGGHPGEATPAGPAVRAGASTAGATPAVGGESARELAETLRQVADELRAIREALAGGPNDA